jgi:hypothetical protein
MKAFGFLPHGRFLKLPYLASAAAFLFFIVYSTPHRVHHVFEQAAATQETTAHHHSHGEPQKSSSPDGTCVFQTVASGCHLSIGDIGYPVPADLSIANLPLTDSVQISSTFLNRRLPIRAPPSL